MNDSIGDSIGDSEIPDAEDPPIDVGGRQCDLEWQMNCSWDKDEFLVTIHTTSVFKLFSFSKENIDGTRTSITRCYQDRRNQWIR
jgi:hypothetical protein